MSCGDSNTCAQETVHTQGSSLSCNTTAQFSAKRHQKGPLCIFNWLKPPESFCSHHSGGCQHLPAPVQAHVALGELGGGRGMTQTELFLAEGESCAPSKGPWKKNTREYPHQAFANACIRVCNMSKGRLSHFSFRHSRHKQASFLILLGYEEGGGTSFPMETAVCTNRPGELQGQILGYGPASLWPKGMQGRLLEKNDHPLQGPKNPTMGLLHPTFPSEAGEWEVAGGRRTG